MPKDLKVGDAVEWDSAGGHSKGKIVTRVTGKAKVKGHIAKASPDEPQFLVKSDTGGTAIHKPSALKVSK